MGYSRKKIVLFFSLIFLSLTAGASSQSLEREQTPIDYAFGLGDRDPFEPLISRNGLILISRKTDVTNMALSGIIYSEGESVVIINNEVVKVGDSIGEYKVLIIGEKSVILEKDGQEFTLNLEE